jgi:hypothetical protein
MNQTIAPVRIVVERSGPGIGPMVLWWTLGAAAVVLVVAVCVWAARRLRRDPLTSAFAKLARREWLTREREEEVKATAEKSGIPPAVLMISAGARAEAARRMTRAV